MDFGVQLGVLRAAADGEFLVALAQAVEDLGFESVWTAEHVVFPERRKTPYPYSADGNLPLSEEAPIADPLISLAVIAGATRRLRLGTAVLILPQRNPLVLAKETATLDRLSGGRLLLGIGVGWLREEFEALGVPFERRGERADEYIRVMRKLWTEPVTEHHGHFVDFAPVRMFPKPARPGGVHVVVGGRTPAASRRAGRLGDGFYPNLSDPEKVRSVIAAMRDAAREAGRDPETVEITASAPRDRETLLALEDLGVRRVVTAALGSDQGIEGAKAKLGRFLERMRSGSH